VNDIVVVSDLHLGAHDDVSYAEAFARFLDHHRDANIELLVLGDALDVLEARPRATGTRRPIDTSDAAARDTLDWIARRHGAFFAAVGRFAADGHRVHVVPGNHDIELVRVPVQERFRELAGAAVTFHPWIFLEPGLLYAEHGHQHHDVNSIATLLRPEQPRHPDRLDLPLASHLVEGRLRFLVHAARHAATLSGPGLARRRAAYRRDVLTPEIVTVDLDAETLVALDRVAETTVPAMARRLLRRAVHRRPARPTQRGGYLHRAAAAIDGVLRGAGAEVPHLVFGHTHIAERFPVGTATGPEYLNGGTWSPFIPRDLRTGGTFTFVRVSPDTGARILRWDDATGRPVDLPAAGRGQPSS
jgi:UDP-2,3-diacylglucosamine pyrophosphatase LpxH